VGELGIYNYFFPFFNKDIIFIALRFIFSFLLSFSLGIYQFDRNLFFANISEKDNKTTKERQIET